MSTSEEIARNLRDAATVVEKLGLGRSRLICVSCDTFDKAEFLVWPSTFLDLCDSIDRISRYDSEDRINAVGYLVSGHQRYKVSTVVSSSESDWEFFVDLLEESKCQS